MNIFSGLFGADAAALPRRMKRRNRVLPVLSAVLLLATLAPSVSAQPGAEPQNQEGPQPEPGAGRNDAADIISVDIGIDLWDKYGSDVTPEDIREEILTRVPDYIEAPQEEGVRVFLIPWDDGR